MSIIVDNLTVSYRSRPAVHHVSAEFADQSMWAVFGPNGAGKSTLLKAVMGLQKADTGCVRNAETSPICRSSRKPTAASR